MLKINNPINKEDVQQVKMADGIYRKTLVYNDTAMICYFSFKEDAKIPLHNHEAHQIGYVLSGQIKFITEDREFIVSQGDSYIFNSYEKHGAICLKPAEIIETFTPPRQEYREK